MFKRRNFQMSNPVGQFPELCRLHQILLGDGRAKPIVVLNEATDEFMQTVLEDFFDPAVHQARAHGARLALRRSLATIGCREMIKILH